MYYIVLTPVPFQVGFVTPDFWYQFAFPLIQVGERIFSMATTPAHSGTFFSTFCNDVIAANTEGNFLFYLINHSVICDACREDGKSSCFSVLSTHTTHIR